jgi:hypothetical protein
MSKELSRLEIAAVKRMEKSLVPLTNEQKRIDTKIASLTAQKADIEGKITQMTDILNTYCGGDYKEVLASADSLKNTTEKSTEVLNSINTEESSNEEAKTVEEPESQTSNI